MHGDELVKILTSFEEYGLLSIDIFFKGMNMKLFYVEAQAYVNFIKSIKTTKFKLSIGLVV